MALFFQRAYDLDCTHDTKGAVIFAALGDRVGVRTQGDGRQVVVGAGPAPDYVSGGVDSGFQTGFLHQLDGVVPPGDVLWGISHSVHTFRAFAQVA